MSGEETRTVTVDREVLERFIGEIDAVAPNTLIVPADIYRLYSMDHEIEEIGGPHTHYRTEIDRPA